MSDTTSQKVVDILNCLLAKFYLRMKIRNASFLVTFRNIKTEIKVVTADADELVGHSYQIEPSGVELSILEAM